MNVGREGSVKLHRAVKWPRRIAGTIVAMMALLFTLTAGCASSLDQRDGNGTLRIAQISTAIGDDGSGQQRLSYSTTLVNGTANPITVRTVQPVLSDQFARRSAGGVAAITVNRILSPSESLTVSGEVSFGSRDASKEDIAGWGQAIAGARVVLESDVKAPWTK